MRLSLTVVALLTLVTPAYAQLAVPNDAGLTYGHVHLNVSDMELHKQLWVEHFGGVVTQKGPHVAVRLPGFLVALSDREPTGPSQGSIMDHFGFKVRSIAKFLAKWRAAGYEVDSEFTGAEGQLNAYVTMPDGVRVELQEDQMLPVEIAGYHIHFFTPEYEELLDWYLDVFGLELRPRGRIQTTTNVPGMNMSFGDTSGEHAPSRGRAIDHIGFELDDLEAFCEQLKAKGIAFNVESQEIDSIELKIAFLTDPAGTYIELTEGYDAY
ncbi:VOC family protein [bacterium AH-315-O15]|nr:VOC family protein [bacterium AH-315-O15]